MNTFTKIATAATTALLLSGGLAMADCADTTTSTSNSADATKTPPISKDGTKAPLEVQPNKDAAASPQKDGSNMPMAEDKNVATSQQDVEAQQHGDQTAAAKAEDKTEPCGNKG
ncbi:hypothetical protein [Mesorhizobium sp. A556]